MASKWHDVLFAIKHKITDPDFYRTVHIGHLYNDDLIKNYERKKIPTKIDRTLKNYYLSEPFHHIYFTQREAECLKLLAMGHTNRIVSIKLGLSERTVEFYIRNMREKTGTHSKQTLLDFMAKIDLNEEE